MGTEHLGSRKYLAVVVRTQLFNPKDPAEIAEVNRLQDSVVAKADCGDPQQPQRWDQDFLKALLLAVPAGSQDFPVRTNRSR
jgi:hypothetical protein